MKTEELSIASQSAEIVPGNVSGGTNTSHTIVVSALAALLEAVPADATQARYEEAAVEGNILGKQTTSGSSPQRSRSARNRRASGRSRYSSFRYLRVLRSEG
jgi:hypothetical protein